MKNLNTFFRLSIGVISIFFFSLHLSSCKKEKTVEKVDPVVSSCFKISPMRFVGINEIASFQNCSQNYDRFEWDFGDGTSSTISEPSHSWKTKNIYKVNLNAFKGATSNRYSMLVFVNQKASIKFTAKLKWDHPEKYYGHFVPAYLHRSNDMQTLYSYYTTYFTNTFGDSNQVKNLTGNATMIDEYSTFKIRMVVDGYYHTFPGSPDFVDSDTLITDEISAIDGAKTPTASVRLKFCTINYTLSPISFY